MKRARVMSLALAGVMAASTLLAGCGSSSGSGSKSGSESASNGGKVLNVWSWNDEFKTRFNDFYPDVKSVSKDKTTTTLKDGTVVKWTINPNQDGVYQQKLDEALQKQKTAKADDKIDIFLAEADYLAKYSSADANVSMPLKDLGIDVDKDLSDQYEYTHDAAKDKNGDVRAISWQACPGLFVYRRGIAKDAFGTDDPDQIQNYVKDWDTFEQSAQTLKDKGYYMLSSMGADTYRVFNNNVSTPWVTGTTVNVDPNMMKWIDQSKEFTDNGYNHKVKEQWSDDWNKDQGPDSKVFGWFFPAWGINFTIQPNAGDAGAGDWAVCNGPQAYNWGGSFIMAAQGTDNKDLVKDVMLKLCADKDTLLKITDKTLDYTNTKSGMEEYANDDSKGASDFLGGENPYKYYAPAAENVKMDKITAYDQGCGECFQDAFGDYFDGKVSEDKAKENFETAIKERYPEITDVKWPE